MATGCGKNRFSISGNIDDAGSRSIRVIYTALSNTHDELVSVLVQCENNLFSIECATRYPTIAWIVSSDGRLLHAVYAEKGDKIVINGNFNSPLEWVITGNKASENYSKWMIDNVGLLTCDDPSEVNGAIAKYVKENPKEVAAALLLLTFYHRNANESAFERLWESLKISDKEKERLLHVAMAQLDNAQEKAAAVTVTPLTLRSKADSIVTLRPADARATILYFWRRTDGPHKGALRVLASQPEDVQFADIYLDPDTVQWRYMTQNDTIRPRNALWGFGGEMNLSLSRLAIPQAPYFIVTNSGGKQVYRGNSVAEASAAAARVKH